MKKKKMENPKIDNVFFTASTIVEVEKNEATPLESPNERPEFYY